MKHCRLCTAPLSEVFCDLGLTPLANDYLPGPTIDAPQTYYPLRAYVCSCCWLVQVAQFERPERLFTDYAYFSSYSTSWLAHAEQFANDMTARLALGPQSLVLEVASNDGYLLQYFRRNGIPTLGVEPAHNVAAVARERGIETMERLLNPEEAGKLVAAGRRADLVVANNVLAHVPDLNGFVAALAMLMKPDGVLTLEFPHLARLIEQNQFDTIYHEHFSYFSLMAAQSALERHGLRLFDVEEWPTHGGSLRLYAQTHHGKHPLSARIDAVLDAERAMGMDQLATYRNFQGKVHGVQHALLAFLLQAKNEGRHVAAYGAAAKGNTLLNSCGIGPDLIDYVVDRSPHKQGRLLPGSGIPIYPVEQIERTRPDYVLLLAWNLKQEIMQQMVHIRQWGARFVVAVPQLEVLA